MELTLTDARGRRWSAPLDRCVDLSRPLDPARPTIAFGLPPVEVAPFRAGGFVGDTREGGAVNCALVSLAPHGSGTHTECVGHIIDARTSVSATLRAPLLLGQLVWIACEAIGASGERYDAPHAEDARVITRRALEDALDPDAPSDALVIARHGGDQPSDWTGSNPPYLTSDAACWLAQRGVQHVLLDVPSIDREEDDGLLPNHRHFWAVPLGGRALTPESRAAATISELLHIPPETPAGAYALFVQLPPLALDAAPSRVLAAPLTHVL